MGGLTIAICGLCTLFVTVVCVIPDIHNFFDYRKRTVHKLITENNLGQTPVAFVSGDFGPFLPVA